MADANMVTIPLAEYLELKESVEWLECLQAAGVDNWDGISYAHELMGYNE